MYSVVLMTALSATPDTPQFNGYFRDVFHGDQGCSGCSGCGGCGGTRYSCSGGCSGAAAYPTSCNGCNGGCNGCCGGGFLGLGLGERVRRFFEPVNSGYGCCSGRSYSCSGYSCSGSAYSCFGGPAVSYNPTLNGGLSCQGGLPMTAPPPTFDPYMQPFPQPGMPGVPYAVPTPAPGTTGLRPTVNNAALTSNGQTARATVIVRVPADARLFADGRTLNLVGAERKFVTPALPVGQEFVYKFTAEYERGGETVGVTKRVTIRAGATINVEFTDLTASGKKEEPSGIATAGGATGAKTAPSAPVTPEPAKVAPSAPVTTPAPAPAPTAPGDRATITVKLPPGATLYVDDRKSPSADPVRQFATPMLPAGREFAYLLKAEVIRNGQAETLTQKVPFRAGERVVVDFTSLGK